MKDKSYCSGIDVTKTKRSHSICGTEVVRRDHFADHEISFSRRRLSVIDGIGIVCRKLEALTFDYKEDDDLSEVPTSPFLHRVVQLQSSDVNEKYETKEVIASGRFGTVYICLEKASGLKLAAKCIRKKTVNLRFNSTFQPKRKPNNFKEREQQLVEMDTNNEISILNQINHPNIVKLYDAHQSYKEYTLIMEYIGGGELFNRLIEEEMISEFDSIKYLRQIVGAVQYLHKNMILHLDLKPENILLVNRNTHHLKLIDFGLSRRYDPRKPICVKAGTIEFMAPEIIAYNPISKATDMWSIGVIAFIFLVGNSPFLGDSDSETVKNISNMIWDYECLFFTNCSDDAIDFLKRLIVYEKNQRMSATQCLNHIWLSKPLSKRKKEKEILQKNLLTRFKWKASCALVSAATWFYDSFAVKSQDE